MKRIVTLDPATTEIVAFLDGTSRIVGVPEDADYPEEVKQKVKVTRKLVNVDNSSYGQSTQNKRTNKTKYYKRKGNKQVRRKTT
ncbi:hypothetical protein WIW90_05300 [Sulfolobaceae archaeon RB850M]